MTTNLCIYNHNNICPAQKTTPQYWTGCCLIGQKCGQGESSNMATWFTYIICTYKWITIMEAALTQLCSRDQVFLATQWQLTLHALPGYNFQYSN